MQTEKRRCKNCKFWGLDHYQVCDRVGYADVDLDSSSFLLDLDAADDQDLSGQLVTGADFGCIKHKFYNEGV